jgi:hypothetical protein
MSAVRSVALALLLASGCATEPDLPPDQQPRPLVPGKNGCHEVATLDGVVAGSLTLGPYVFGTGTFCLHLDASQLRRGHFMASTRYESGIASGFTIELTLADGTPLAAGGDVTVGQADPMTFASLETPITGGTALDVRLVVSALDRATGVNVALFDPLE